jgi:Holliday junction resolvase
VSGGKAPRAAGDYFERRTKDALEADGFYVIRTAGSHGIADLVALRAGEPALMISCKRGGAIGRAELFRLVDTARKAGALAVLARQRRPGWAELEEIGKHVRVPLLDLHFPPPPRRAPE